MFKGSLVAIVTPMHADGAIDYQRFEQLLNWHVSGGSDGVVILGTTGESATIDFDERSKIIQLSLLVINKRVPVIVGTGANSTAHAIKLTQQAADLGADAALIVTPYYNKPTQNGLFLHYAAITEAVNLPVILYNVPGRTACDLLPETVKRLSQYSRIVGLKDATGCMDRLAALLSLNLSMQLFSGDDPTAMAFMLGGGHGVISVSANVAPAEVHQLCQYALSQNKEAAEKVNNQLLPLYSALFIESNPIPTKWVLHEMGFIDVGIRLPLTRLDAKYQSVIIDAMRAAEIVSLSRL